jgi:hypothetical protein
VQQVYLGRLKAIEEMFFFERFYSPCLGPSDFEAKPSVLLLGQYSTGKTTFIKHLLERSYPGSNIGPEPTTDRFTVVTHGYEDRQIPGNTLTVSPDLPYQSLHHFGTGLLSRLEGVQCNAPLLHSVSLVDTPGVLSGEKQRIERSYDFVKVRLVHLARIILMRGVKFWKASQPTASWLIVRPTTTIPAVLCVMQKRGTSRLRPSTGLSLLFLHNVEKASSKVGSCTSGMPVVCLACGHHLAPV